MSTPATQIPLIIRVDARITSLPLTELTKEFLLQYTVVQSLPIRVAICQYWDGINGTLLDTQAQSKILSSLEISYCRRLRRDSVPVSREHGCFTNILSTGDLHR